MNPVIEKIVELSDPQSPARFRRYLTRLSEQQLTDRLNGINATRHRTGQNSIWRAARRHLKPV